MMKQGKTGVSQIAGIILILIVLVILVVSLTGLYGQTFKDSIKKIFGVQTEAEEYHETNVKSETYFENLVVDIQKCKNSQKNNCGCELDLSGFGPNHLIRTKKEQIEILDIGKIGDESIYDKDGVLLVESADIKNMDCIFDKNLKKTDDKIMAIFFHKDSPEITYVESNFWDRLLSKVSKREFHTVKKEVDKQYKLYKTDKDTCWLQETGKTFPSCV